MKEVQLVIRNQMGLHARACAMFVKAAARFPATEVYVSRDDLEVNGKSIMGVMMLAAEEGSMIKVRAEGDQEDAAIAVLLWASYNSLHLLLRARGVEWGYRGGPAVLGDGLRQALERLIGRLSVMGSILVGILMALLLVPGGEPREVTFQVLLIAGVGRRASAPPTATPASCSATTWRASRRGSSASRTSTCASGAPTSPTSSGACCATSSGAVDGASVFPARRW
ncbi:MAG: HPr family phosphocarrier protein [Candidatus Eisenbacteria bacterium]|uniref:HPr family phosphocarrier protein n=1 Tax=Eiseniibacteriota bacterium TaxID=2212470 RepID=A0A538U2L8_UNCEI|nr:MAG: HPr family phosphocarrier protein [Candidatus Eisenbacteria bacterium]